MKKYCWLLLPSENNSYIRIHRLWFKIEGFLGSQCLLWNSFVD
jgi:hypothetical protein